MKQEDRMSLLLQLASCFLAFLSEVEDVLKSVEKVQVLFGSVELRIVKESRSLTLPIHLFSCLSEEVFPPISSAWIYRTEEYAQQSGGHVTNPINRVLRRSPFCPPLPHMGCPACLTGFAKASGYQDEEHLLPAALCPRKETEFSPDNKTQQNLHGSTWFTFVYPSRGFCLAEVTDLFCLWDTQGKTGFVALPFFSSQKHLSLKWTRWVCPFLSDLFLLGLHWHESVLFQFSTTCSSMHWPPIFLQ